MTDWKHIEMQTPRLLLRPWREEDAEALYRFASDPLVGPSAGWPPHADAEDSRRIIRGVLSARETYALLLRHDTKAADGGELIPAGTPVGSVGIMFTGCGSYPHIRRTEAEIGYWICRPLWGRGLVPEAVTTLTERCFGELGLEGLWCGYYEGNEKSLRVQQKCGFVPHTHLDIPPHPLNGATREHFTYLSRENWEARSIPVTHEMSLREAPFRAVEAGRKTIEMRLFDEKRRRIRVGDSIRFRLDGGHESVLVCVERIHYFPTFEALYAALIPTHGKTALGYRQEETSDPADMLDYYSASQIARHGVVGIEIILKEGSPS